MQTVMALCHFCENHGPRVVMTTQSIRESSSSGSSNCCCDSSILLPGRLSSPSGDYMLSELHDDEARCMACTSFSDGQRLVTTDVAAGISYISSQVAINERVYQLVKHACLRSLSGEVSESLSDGLQQTNKSIGIETSILEKDFHGNGIILFGDDDHGYTLSHTFRLRDAKARGFQRWFSLIVICMDKLLITNNYEFFVSSLSTIIHQLQEQSNNVFYMEHSGIANECLKQASRASLLPIHFMRRNYVTKLDLDTSRSLALITHNNDIFTKLHKQMTYVLRTQARLCTESVLEGIPTQDALVELEVELELTNSSNIFNNNNNNNKNNNNNNGNKNSIADSNRTNFITTTDYGVDALQQVIALQNIAKKFDKFKDQRSLGSCAKEDQRSLGSCADLQLDPLEMVLKHLVVGGQVLIKCDEACLARQVLIAFAYLLPIGCVHLTYSQHYEPVLKFNLLACPMSLEIPPDVDDIVVASMIFDNDSECCNNIEKNSNYSQNSFTDNSNQSDDERYDMMMMLQRPDTMDPSKSSMISLMLDELSHLKIVDFIAPSKEHSRIDELPTIVSRYKQLLLDEELSCRVVEAVLKNTREQWLSKSKLIYQLSRQKEGIDLREVLRVVKCTQNDASVLKFWQSGLSKTYKQHVLNTINSYEQICT